MDLFLPLPRGDLDVDPDLFLNPNLVLDIEIISPPPDPLSLFLLDNNPRRWGEHDTLFLVKVVVVEEEKVIALSLEFVALVFLEEDESNIYVWWWE